MSKVQDSTWLIWPTLTLKELTLAKLNSTGLTSPDGTFEQIDTVTINGEVVADFTQANGTYSVNPDCTGTFTIDFTDMRPPVVTSFVVVENGLEIDTVVTSAGGKQGILALGTVGKKLSFW